RRNEWSHQPDDMPLPGRARSGLHSVTLPRTQTLSQDKQWSIYLGPLGHSNLRSEIRSSNFEIRNKFKILISKSRKCTARKLARFEFSILGHLTLFRISSFGFRVLSQRYEASSL